MSLRVRLTLVAAAAVAVAVAGASLFAYRATRRELLHEVDESLVERVEALAGFRPGPARRDPVDPARFPTPRFGAAGGFAQVVLDDGRILVAPGNDELPVSEQALDVASGTGGRLLEDVQVDGDRVRVLTEPFAEGVAVQVARPLDEVDALLGRLRWLLAGATVAGVVLAAGLGLVVARAALRPVHQLTETAEEVTRTLDLARRIDVAGRDELARLAASFNTMLAALQASVDAQRQLVADASHELRTPLTSLRTNVDVLARADELDPEERDRLRRDVDGQIAELAGLVGDVIELAREGEPVRVTEDVRLDELVAMAVEQAAFHWPQARFDTDLDPVTVRGVPERLERAVANLLDNAGKWSPPDAPVEVTVRGRELVVRDHGPGVAPGDATHVFDRFWRSPAARDLPGSGLGLSIVRQVADSHGATVSVEPAPGGGALFRLRFPDP